MVYPILITVPYKGEEHRLSLQRRIIEAIEKDLACHERAFYDNFWFYPYYNRTSSKLTPKQLYKLLDEELGLFYPEEAMHGLGGFDDDYVSYPRQIRQPVIPPYYNKLEKRQIEQQKWDDHRFAIVIDNEELRHFKLFEVSGFDLSRYALRRHLDAGDPLSESQREMATEFNSDDDEDITDDEGNRIHKRVRNCNDDGEEDPDPTLQNQHAALFLGKPTSKWCRLRGILATRIATDRVASAVVNLQQANMDFENFTEGYWGPDPKQAEWSPLPKLDPEQLADGIEEIAL